jgi:hypothetical protein
MNIAAAAAQPAVTKMVIKCDSHDVSEPLNNNSFKNSKAVMNNAAPKKMASTGLHVLDLYKSNFTFSTKNGSRLMATPGYAGAV